jgi:hypothetical protein
MKAKVRTLRDRELFLDFLEFNDSDRYKGSLWDDNEIVNIPAKMAFKYFTAEDFDDNNMLLPLNSDEYDGYEVDVAFDAYYGDFEVKGEFYDDLTFGRDLETELKHLPDGKYELKISLQKVD